MAPILSCSDDALIKACFPRARRVCPSVPRTLITDAQLTQFSFPDAGSPGATGRNAFRNAGFWNMNFSMYKNFRVTERSKLQFRSEFFNVFNHPVMENLPNERKNLSSADFGRFVAQRNDPRIMQFALKFEF